MNCRDVRKSECMAKPFEKSGGARRRAALRQQARAHEPQGNFAQTPTIANVVARATTFLKALVNGARPCGSFKVVPVASRATHGSPPAGQPEAASLLQAPSRARKAVPVRGVWEPGAQPLQATGLGHQHAAFRGHVSGGAYGFSPGIAAQHIPALPANVEVALALVLALKPRNGSWPLSCTHMPCYQYVFWCSCDHLVGENAAHPIEPQGRTLQPTRVRPTAVSRFKSPSRSALLTLIS